MITGVDRIWGTQRFLWMLLAPGDPKGYKIGPQRITAVHEK